MNWKYSGEIVTEVPTNAIGFIYRLYFIDGTMYVGKKDIYSYITLPALKSGEQRPNSERKGKNKNGKRIYVDVVKKESNWQDYEGSSKETEGLILKYKEILEWAPSKRSLTYLEVKHQFKLDVLENDKYINQNINGKFFRGRLL